jgi:hypothetical protein
LLENQDITCSQCHHLYKRSYKYCPSCGCLSTQKIIKKTKKSKPDQAKRKIQQNAQFNAIIPTIVFRIIGIGLLIIDLFLLIWLSWAGYVGSLVKFNKPFPKTIFGIDTAFFNITSPNDKYVFFLSTLILFGLLKTGVWFLQLKPQSTKSLDQ